MRLLVTRPRPDADATAALLARAGHEVLVAPLIQIARRSPPNGFPGAGVQAFLATSANGVRALADATDDRQTPVFAVGDASAQTARDCGFAHVESADGDVSALASLIRARLAPGAGRLVHAVGSVSAGNLAQELSGAGFEAVAVVLYEAHTSNDLPDSVARALRNGDLDGALFYSPRTARTFAKLVKRADLNAKLRELTAFCLSNAVAEAFEPVPFSELRVAVTPDQGALLCEIEAYGRDLA